jgi:hypothetical protein
MFWAAASPAGWPPPQHGAAARLWRAAAPQNTTDPHSETLCIEGESYKNSGGPPPLRRRAAQEKLPPILFHQELRGRYPLPANQPQGIKPVRKI